MSALPDPVTACFTWFGVYSTTGTPSCPAAREITPLASATRIAEEMSLSVKTVGTYRARILEKLSVANNAEIMRYAMQHKLIE